LRYTTIKKMNAETEILKELLQTQKDLAQQIYKQAEDFSNYKNSQEMHNFKMMSYLQDDPNSKKEGLISKVDKIDDKVSSLEKDILKKSAAFGVGASGIILVIKWIITKVLI